LKSWNVVVLGATGAVGRAMLECLESTGLSIRDLRLLAGARSAGRRVRALGRELVVEPPTKEAFEGADLALFSAGAAASEVWAPVGVAEGAWVIDNSSRWRMAPDVPLVVPEVNASAIPEKPGLIANPNCSTIQLVVALEPIRRRYGLRSVFVATYQSASGKGYAGVLALRAEREAASAAGAPANVSPESSGAVPAASHVASALPHAGQAPVPAPPVFPCPLDGNVIPHCDVFLPDGFTREEEKMIQETRKILDMPALAVHPTCVRVPVEVAHSEAVYLQTEEPVSAEEARLLLAAAPGVRVLDDPSTGAYPTPAAAVGTDPVWVGRIRADRSDPRGLHLWVVADNLRKGAALNAVQIVQAIRERELVSR